MNHSSLFIVIFTVSPFPSPFSFSLCSLYFPSAYNSLLSRPSFSFFYLPSFSSFVLFPPFRSLVSINFLSSFSVSSLSYLPSFSSFLLSLPHLFILSPSLPSSSLYLSSLSPPFLSLSHFLSAHSYLPHPLLCFPLFGSRAYVMFIVLLPVYFPLVNGTLPHRQPASQPTSNISLVRSEYARTAVRDGGAFDGGVGWLCWEVYSSPVMDFVCVAVLFVGFVVSGECRALCCVQGMLGWVVVTWVWLRSDAYWILWWWCLCV